MQTLGGSKLSKINELGDEPVTRRISTTRSIFWRGLPILQTKNKKYIHTYVHSLEIFLILCMYVCMYVYVFFFVCRMAKPRQKIDLVALIFLVTGSSPNSLISPNFDPPKVCTIFFHFLLYFFIAFKGLKGVKGKVKGEVN